MMRSLLVELLVEELPPKSLKLLSESFAAGLTEALRAQGLVGAEAVSTPFATPRRLALHLTHVLEQAPEKVVRQKLMPVAVGLSAGNQPTPALLKKLTALGTDASVLADLEQALDGKANTLFWSRWMPGVTLAQGLQSALSETLTHLPIPKLMRYQLADGWDSVQFVRPAQGLVALHGEHVVPVSALGLSASRYTQGHRFEALQSPLTLREADSYVQQLQDEGRVIASFTQRRALIQQQLANSAAQANIPDAHPIDDDALLDEVTALVERPHVLLCSFEPIYLTVPEECLILTMTANQKYFPLLDAQGALTHQFLVVSNIHPADPRRIIEGNERVVRPRLADAKFFFDQDCKKMRLEDRVEGLGHVVYHAKLGSQRARVERIRRIAKWVAERIGADLVLADRAAWLAKADLLTDMVAEFPELQGVMGAHYARLDGEDLSVVAAIQGQYLNLRGAPESPGDSVRDALMIADRVETLVGIWGIGLKPTGDKDPFALRRHALTLLNVLTAVSAERDIGLSELLLFTASVFEGLALAPQTIEQVEAFVFERYFHQLSASFAPRWVDAVLSLHPPLHQTISRLNAVSAFAKLPQADALAAANKRVGNILKKSQPLSPGAVDVGLLVEPAEQALYQALLQVAPTANSAFEKGDYTLSLQALAALRTPVDVFFDEVMVNAEDAALRDNRLRLLSQLQAAMNRVADLSQLVN